MVRLPRNEKQTYRLNSRAQIWPPDLTLAMTLTLNFKVKYRICYISAKNSPIATKQKANILIEFWGSNVTIGFDLGHDFDLEFSRSDIEFAISQPKLVRLPRNENQAYWLNSKASNVTIQFDLGHDLDLEFTRSNMEFPISQPKVVRLPRNEKQTYRLNSRPQMWPMGLTLTITLTFRFWRSNVTLTSDHTHDLDHRFSWSNFEIAVSQIEKADWYCTKGVAVGHSWPWAWPFGAKVRCIDLPDSDRVTSVVGVPSSHLVFIGWWKIH